MIVLYITNAVEWPLSPWWPQVW